MPLLQVDGLTVRFRARGHDVTAVDNAYLSVEENQVVGLVGESGCGKSTLARTIVGLHGPRDGRILYRGDDVTRLRGRAQRAYRRKVQYIFQDPYSSLSPRRTVGKTLEEPLIIHGVGDKQAREKRVAELLELVGLPTTCVGRLPASLSGGQRQRVAIARALAVEPELLICDEPVSALDVSIRAQIMNLFLDLQRRLGIGLLFIGHDLSLIRRISDQVAVMYLGAIVEHGPAKELFENPSHPYTQALLAATPTTDPTVERHRDHVLLTGELPSPKNVPAGCRFHTRCPVAFERCEKEPPAEVTVADQHVSACHLAGEVTAQQGAP